MKTQRKIQGEQTKEKIYNTAISLFSTQSYKSVTVDAICKTVGIAKGTFYVHFRSKEDIIKSIYREMVLTYLQQEMSKFKENNPKSSNLDKLYFYCISSLQFCKENSVELTSLSYVTHINTVMETQCNWCGNGFDLGYLKSLVMECRNKREIKEELSTDYVVSCLSKVINGAVIEWCLSNGEYDIVEMNRQFFSSIIYQNFRI
ncbi:Fatty acid metabolism regulator protein [compost metagenome]